MSTKKRLLLGSKFNGNHTTYLEDSQELIRTLRDDDNIKTISLGEIKTLKVIPKNKRTVKCLKIQGGYKITFRGINGRQFFWVYFEKQEQKEFDRIERLVQTVV